MLSGEEESGGTTIDRPEPGAIARGLAHFAHELSHTAIPRRVRDRALHHMLDAAGIGFASSIQDFGRAAFDGLATVAGYGAVPVLGFGARWSPRDAATINGLLCHGLDFDDTHLRGVIHPTVAQFPAALSAAIMANASMEDLVTAYIVGVEASVRLASVAHGAFHAVGFHPSGICNAPAAALTAGRLMGLTVDQLHHAQGIALSMASGTLEFLEDGAWTKRLHPGWAASAGLTAAAMARAGYVGASSPYSGRFGLFRTYLGGDDSACDYRAATAGLGEEWELLQTAIKPYPACHLTHGCIDAAIALSTQLPEAAEIEHVTALVARETVQTICEPIDNKRHPKNGYDAQFSIPFLVASGLLKGRVSLADVDGEALQDQRMLSLAGRIGYEIDDASGFPRHYSGEVIVKLRSGETIRQRQQINSGAPEMPVPDEEIVAKAVANAGTVLTPPTAERLCELFLGMDRARRSARAWADELARIG
jgi:2-methylcitrate dehydratase PrpD